MTRARALRACCSLLAADCNDRPVAGPPLLKRALRRAGEAGRAPVLIEMMHREPSPTLKRSTSLGAMLAARSDDPQTAAAVAAAARSAQRYASRWRLRSLATRLGWLLSSASRLVLGDGGQPRDSRAVYDEEKAGGAAAAASETSTPARKKL